MNKKNLVEETLRRSSVCELNGARALLGSVASLSFFIFSFITLLIKASTGEHLLMDNFQNSLFQTLQRNLNYNNKSLKRSLK